MDISKLIAPDSDEMVAADLIGSPPQIFTIAEVTETARDGNKKVANVQLEEFPRPWRPGKGMSRVMADNWGRETQKWIGCKVELYGDPDVYFGKEKTGGVRISRLSHISAPKTTRINPRTGRGATWTVQPITAKEVQILDLRAAWGTADAERRKDIEAEVARLTAEGGKA